MSNDHSKFASIILAGGKGTRMGVENKHKSTFEIAGVPSIIRLVSNLRKACFPINIIVVGAHSNQIMETVSEYYKDVTYVYQPKQKGTGNAAKQGIYFLKRINYKGPVLIVAGDAYIEPNILHEMINEFNNRNLDFLVLMKNKEASPLSGRLIFDENNDIISSIEFWDIQKSILRDILYEITINALDYLNNIGNFKNSSFKIGITKFIKKIDDNLILYLVNDNKIKKILPNIFTELNILKKSSDVKEFLDSFLKIKKLIEKMGNGFQIKNKYYTARNIEKDSKFVNISVYLCKSNILFKHIDKILSNNAQNEEYLTDIIQILSERNIKIRGRFLTDNNSVLSYNNPEELLKINEYLLKLGNTEINNDNIKGLKKINDWISNFKNSTTNILNILQNIYGMNYDGMNIKKKHYIRALMGYNSRFPGNQEVFIVRTPGRLNLMGRHIDHRGGNVNMLAIDSEVISIISPRDDDHIIAYNEKWQEFPAGAFSISEELSLVEWNDWFGFISNQRIVRMVRNSKGNWINYIKAATLRLQASFQNKRLKGANLYMSGNIPQAAGLSSSSAIVVSTLEALLKINNISLKTREFIDLCGEGEWFVGTRGGSSDHAAIKYSEISKITKLGFFEFKIKESIEFPSDYSIIIINSMKKAQKSNMELKKFNEKILCYEIGLEIIKSKNPKFSKKLKYLRDINPQNLGIETREIYKLFKSVPLTIKVSELENFVDEEKIEEYRKKFTYLDGNDILNIRSVIIYGVTECARSKICLDLLKNGEISKFGELMNISHDGDRVYSYNYENFEEEPQNFDIIYSEELLDAYYTENLPLELVSGGYRCSIKEIDFIVDKLKADSPIIGAQISGAGLGGCVMVLLNKNDTPKIIEFIKYEYKKKWNIELECIVTNPIMGSSILSLD